jgi:hypothetical protein
MSPPGGPGESGTALALRCTRCGTAVCGTRHTRTGYTVGYYVLHGGPTEEATLRRADDEAPFSYRRLVEPVEVVSCPACFGRPDVRRLWETFGDQGSPAA